MRLIPPPSGTTSHSAETTVLRKRVEKLRLIEAPSQSAAGRLMPWTSAKKYLPPKRISKRFPRAQGTLVARAWE